MPASAVLMPTTRPAPSTSAPPELPGFRAASVWMTFSTTRRGPPRAPTGRERPRPLTTPAVTELAKPLGLPMATTSWPTRSSAASPSGAGERSPPSARSTARSESGSEPTTDSGVSWPSLKLAVPWRVPSTTWAEVTRKPSAEMATPLPAPVAGPRRVRRCT